MTMEREKKKKMGKEGIKKKERAEKDDSKASRSLNEENGPTTESAPAEPILNTEYLRIPVLTPLLRGVSPTCHLRGKTTGDDIRMLEDI